MLLSLQVVANLILMMGVNVAGIFVYDRRDQVHRKLFTVIRTCSSASLRIQDERSKLVLICILIQSIVLAFMQHNGPVAQHTTLKVFYCDKY